MRKVLSLAIHILLSAFAGLLLLVLAYFLPTDVISKNMVRSAEIIRSEGEYPVLSEWFRSTADNHTDALMLMEASEDTYPNALDGALKVSSSRVGDESSAESLAMHFLDDMEYTRTDSYARYWHGYLVILKPLLLITNLGGIRVINAIMQIAMLALVCYLLVTCNRGIYVIPYAISYLMLRPLVLARCMQFSTCYYILALAAIAVLVFALQGKLRERAFLVFLYAGIATAYFDYLTYPIATFGVPMVVLLVLDDENQIKEKVLNIFRYGIIWGAGYGIMWSLKWVLASILTDENVIADALRTVLERTSSAGHSGAEQFSRFNSIIWNIKAFVYTPVTVMALVYIIVLIVIGLRNKKITVDRAALLLPYALVALLPVLWYAATVNHSCFHTFYTNKGCVVSLIAVMFGVTKICLRDIER